MTHVMDGNNKCNTWMYNNKEIFFRLNMIIYCWGLNSIRVTNAHT